MSELKWKTKDGLEMYARSCAPAEPPRAVVCLVHGLGEHVGRYDHVGEVLTKAGFAMLGFDLRGHGRSEGPRGHTPSYQAIMDDIRIFITQAKDRFDGKPIFLYGHSLGANLVINFTLREKPEIRGVIATGPWLELAFKPPSAQVLLAKVMAGIFPGLTQPNGLDTSALSRVPAVEEAYINDPLVHNKISAKLFLETYQAGLWALEHASEFPIPLLLMHGTADRICSVEASRKFAQSNPEKVEGSFFDGWFHEIHNEADADLVFSRMIEFLNKNI
ncbi:MAG TPA: lysophospholipase [Anaerolineales bacterium]|nr:lysophospholipase [Anaerolineales bacterium]